MGQEDLKGSCKRQEGVSLHTRGAGESKDTRQAVERSSGTTISHTANRYSLLQVLQTHILVFSPHFVRCITSSVSDGQRGEDARFPEDVLGQKDS